MSIFRILQIAVGLLILPMVLLGFMSGLSGGGGTPAFQRIGTLLAIYSPFVAIAGIAVGQIFWGMNLATFAYIAVLVPVAVWVGLIVWLQVSTGFFF